MKKSTLHMFALPKVVFTDALSVLFPDMFSWASGNVIEAFGAGGARQNEITELAFPVRWSAGPLTRTVVVTRNRIYDATNSKTSAAIRLLPTSFSFFMA